MIVRCGRALLVVIGCLVIGCKGVGSLRPEKAQPGGVSASFLGRAKEGEAFARTTWWRGFGSKSLDLLVEEALEGNRDLAAALLTLERVEAEGLIASGRRGVSVGGRGAVRSAEIGDWVPDVAIEPGRGTISAFDLLVGWEPDLLGRLRNGVKAAKSDTAASAAVAVGVREEIACQVCAAYVDLMSARAAGLIAERSAQQQEKIYRVVRVKVESGAALEVDAARAEGAWRKMAAEVPGYRAAERSAANRLALLCGSEPGKFVQRLARTQLSKLTSPGLPKSIGAQVLRRRADVRAAEHRLVAAGARLDVAFADLFPRVRIEGIAGLHSLNSTRLLAGSSGLWNVGPSVEWPIFSGGARRAKVAADSAEQRLAVVSYEKAVLTALVDADTALYYERAVGSRLKEIEAASQAARRVLALVQTAYEGGSAPLMDLLDARVQASDAELALVRARAEWVLGIVRVFRAVGGGL